MRHPRDHRISTAFIGKIHDKVDIKESMVGDDAVAIKCIDLTFIDEQTFGFDHKKILEDYKKWKLTNLLVIKRCNERPINFN